MTTEIGATLHALGLRAAQMFLATTLLILPVAWAAGRSAPVEEGPVRTWDFESDSDGAPAAGFTVELGDWKVGGEAGRHTLEQTADSPRRSYNLVLADHTSYTNLDITVKVQANAGEIDQGGGPIWRAQDRDNYYLARYNPLESNVRLYKVEAGRRTQLDHAEAPADKEWHTIRITTRGREIVGYLDGQRLLVAEDSTFLGAGKVGLWSKADARSSFDDLSVREIAPPEPSK